MFSWIADRLRGSRKPAPPSVLKDLRVLKGGPATDRAALLDRVRRLARLSPRRRRAHEDMLLSMLSHADAELQAEARRVVRFAYTFEELDERLRTGRAAAAAAELLGALDHDTVVEVLFSLAARAADPQVREAAARGLCYQPADRVVSAALEALDSEQPDAGAASAGVLRALGDPAVRLLTGALSAPRRQVRLGAIRALAMIGGEPAANAVAQVVRDPAEEVRAQAVRVLAALRPGATDEGALSGLTDPAAAVRVEAATALARADSPDAAAHVARFLRACADDPDFEVADQEFLGAIAAMKSLSQDVFLAVLNGRNQSFAVSLALALEEAGVVDSWLTDLPAALPAYARCLKDLLRAVAALGAREPFLRALEAPSATVRAFAAQVLGECRFEEAAPALGVLLTDEDPEVRRTALDALVGIEPSQGAAAAVEALSDPSPKVREAAVSALAEAANLGGLKSGAQLALPPASDPDNTMRVTYGLPVAMSQALGKLAPIAGSGGAEGQDAVLSGSAAIGRALRDPSPQVRARAARALGEIGTSASAHALVERALNDEHADVRAACAETLGQSPTAEVSEALCLALREGQPEMRRRAADALECLGDRASAPSLLNALQDTDAEVRRLAGRALWAIADTAMGEVLLEHLHSPDPAVRAAIAGLLGKVHAPYGLEPVANRLEDPHCRVRAAAANALGTMGEMAQSALPRLAAALADPDPYVRCRAADAMGQMGTAAADHLHRLLDALDDDEEAVREAVRRCAVGLANQGALTPFVNALRDDVRRERVRRVLMHVGLPVMRILLRMAYDANSSAGEQLLDIVAEALRKRGSFDECRKDLLSLDPTVRLSGLEALGLMATPEAVALIAQAMQNDPLPSLRARAGEVLETIQPPAPAPSQLPAASETAPEPVE